MPDIQGDNKNRSRSISFIPTVVEGSGRWKYWKTMIDGRQCVQCYRNNGKIYDVHSIMEQEPPLHDNCRCSILELGAVRAGSATLSGMDGADWHLFYTGVLPDAYISKAEAKMLGWVKRKGNLWDVAPERIMGGDDYENKNNKLPSVPGRLWYEADINYFGGYRATHRILYSNDGLIFVTYDHYETFFEII